MAFENPDMPLDVLAFPGVTLFVSSRGPCSFDSITYDDDSLPRPIPGRSSTDTHYVAPLASGKHVLPQHAALPIMAADGTWNPPSDETIATAREILFATTGVKDILDPKWARVKRWLDLHEDKGLPEESSGSGPITQFNDTDMGWLQNNFSYTHGSGSRPQDSGWYHGANFRSGGNGYDNYHYGRIWWMGVRIILEDDPAKRVALWPYFLEASINHVCYGRLWSGPEEGGARDEKGFYLVGDTNRNPTSKQWASNPAMSYMLTGNGLFKAALHGAHDWWNKKSATKVFSGHWGSRQPARHMEDLIVLGLTVPELRVSCEQQLIAQLDNMDSLLSRTHWLWENKGNGGNAEESPWMQSQVVSAVMRAWELLPATKGHGPSLSDMDKVMAKIFSDAGSEVVGGYRCLRYRYHTTTHPARFVANTAFAVPALRHLAGSGIAWAKAQYKESARLIYDHGEKHISELANLPDPFPIDQAGFRYPSQGGAWPKPLMNLIDSVR